MIDPTASYRERIQAIQNDNAMAETMKTKMISFLEYKSKQVAKEIQFFEVKNDRYIDPANRYTFYDRKLLTDSYIDDNVVNNIDIKYMCSHAGGMIHKPNSYGDYYGKCKYLVAAPQRWDFTYCEEDKILRSYPSNLIQSIKIENFCEFYADGGPAPDEPIVIRRFWPTISIFDFVGSDNSYLYPMDMLPGDLKYQDSTYMYDKYERCGEDWTNNDWVIWYGFTQLGSDYVIKVMNSLMREMFLPAFMFTVKKEVSPLSGRGASSKRPGTLSYDQRVKPNLGIYWIRQTVGYRDSIEKSRQGYQGRPLQEKSLYNWEKLTRTGESIRINYETTDQEPLCGKHIRKNFYRWKVRRGVTWDVRVKQHKNINRFVVTRIDHPKKWDKLTVMEIIEARKAEELKMKECLEKRKLEGKKPEKI